MVFVPKIIIWKKWLPLMGIDPKDSKSTNPRSDHWAMPACERRPEQSEISIFNYLIFRRYIAIYIQYLYFQIHHLYTNTIFPFWVWKNVLSCACQIFFGHPTFHGIFGGRVHYLCGVKSREIEYLIRLLVTVFWSCQRCLHSVVVWVC